MQKELLHKIRKITEIQQLDFEHDNRLFIDPYRINENDGEIAKKAKEKIIKYFEIFFKAIETSDRNTVLYIGKRLHEINATKLGYTRSGLIPNGKGFSQKDLLQIYDAAVEVKDLIEDMPDVFILAENIGPDKISDITTNIIYEELLQFSNYIIDKYKLDIKFERKSKFIFDVYEEKWIKKEFEVPIIDEEEILFLPNKIVESYEIFSYETVYKKLVYPYYKVHTAIHRLIRLLKNKEERPDCKKIKKEFPLKRNTVRTFKEKFPLEYKKYKQEMQKYYWLQEKM